MTRKDNRGFTIFILCFWLIFCMAFDFYTYPAGLALSVVICLIYIFLPLEKQWLFALSALPFMGVFKISASMFSTSIFLYLIFVVKGFVKGYRLSRKFLGRFILLFTIQTLLLVLYRQSMTSLISLSVNLLFMIQTCNMFENIEKSGEMFRGAAFIYIMSVSLMTFLSKIFTNMTHVVQNGRDTSLWLDGALTSRFSGIAGDPNYYTQLILISIALAVGVLIVYKTGIIQKLIFVGCSIYLLICGVMTYSKSFYITLALLLILVLFYVYKRNVNHSSVLAILILITPLIVFGVYIFIMNFVVPGVLQRVNSTVDLTSGRAEIWKCYAKLLWSKPHILLLGAGTGNARNMITSCYGKAEASHNAAIEIISDMGIIGCRLLYDMFKSALAKLKSEIGSPLVLYFFMFLITSMSLSFSSYDTVYFAIPMLILIDSDRQTDATVRKIF